MTTLEIAGLQTQAQSWTQRLRQRVWRLAPSDLDRVVLRHSRIYILPTPRGIALMATLARCAVVVANDEFFAARDRLVIGAAAVWREGEYTERGKWMDGWESRRRRTPGHDWCVVALGMRGRVRGVNVDTSFFTGNFPPHCSIDAVDAARPLKPSEYSSPGAPWTGARTCMRSAW